MGKHSVETRTEIGRSQYPAAVAGFQSAACLKGHCKACNSLKCGCVCHRLKGAK